MHVDKDEVLARFHARDVTAEQLERMNKIRFHMAGAAAGILAETPAGREQSVALTKLEEVSFFAIAAIARGQ
jgi:hypothetical protein